MEELIEKQTEKFYFPPAPLTDQEENSWLQIWNKGFAVDLICLPEIWSADGKVDIEVFLP